MDLFLDVDLCAPLKLLILTTIFTDAILCKMLRIVSNFCKNTNTAWESGEFHPRKGPHSDFNVIIYRSFVVLLIYLNALHLMQLQKFRLKNVDPERPSDLRAMLFLVFKCSYLNRDTGEKNPPCSSE